MKTRRAELSARNKEEVVIRKGSYGSKDRKEQGPRTNQKIKAREVRLISPDGEQLGIFMTSEALRRAEEDGLDLVEVAPGADPPVCRIMDYGKYKYQQQKKEHEAKKKQTYIQLKEIKVRPKIKEHDLETKVRHVRRFLQAGNKAKITVIFRWRELSHPEMGKEVLERVQQMVEDLAQVESQPKMETRSMTMVLAPKKGQSKEPKGAKEKKETKESENA